MKTNLVEKVSRCLFAFVFVFATASMPDRGVIAQEPAQIPDKDVLYTTDVDFDQGTLISVNHDAPYNDQLQLNSPTEPFPFINVAASGRGTMVRTNTETGEIVGEYRTAPEGRGLNPSRTTVDLFGNVWTANRDEAGVIDDILHGSVVKIGLIVGGTRVDETGSPNPEGGYLAPPYGYNTCIDRNGDGLIRTSKGLADVLDWPDLTDGPGGSDGIVQDAVDECILIYQRLPNAENARHVSVDADNNVWVGGYPYAVRTFYKLDGSTGAILDSFDAREIGCGGYGGLVDGNGILWSVGGALLRYDPATHTGFCIPQYGYGLGIDTNGYIWMSMWDGGIVKIAPDGTVMPGFPKPTFPPSITTSSLATEEMSALAAPQIGSASAATLSQTAARDRSSTKLHSQDRGPSKEAGQSQMTTFPQGEVEALSEPLAGDPTVTFWVAPIDDWVQSSSPWTPGATITLTIEDSGTVVYTDSQVADSGGNFNFNLGGIFDLKRGQVVTVTDGTTTKTHTVLPLYVQHIDMSADAISGTGAANTAVDVWVHGDGGMTVTADGSGNWAANFLGQTDLTYLSDGGSAQSDEDGDATGVWWASPRFQVAPNDDWVQSSGTWTPGATITMSVSDGGAVVYSDSQIADLDGHFNFNFGDVFDLQRGQVVTVSDGTTTKSHTVTNLFVDGIDVAADTVFGRAAPGTSVDVWVHGNGNQTATANGSGDWTADFSGQTDLAYTNNGGSQQIDEDGDSTGVWWAYPSFRVNPDDDWVESRQSWRPGETITLTITDGGIEVYSDTQAADSHGNFGFYLWDVFDLQRGQVVTVTDGVTTKTHTVTDLFVDAVNVEGNTVSGRAAAGTSVDVWVNGDGELNFVVDGSENWTADFSSMTDITYFSNGSARQIDSDGDVTRIDWSSPRFQVAPDDNWVQSWSRWTPGATITLSIEDGGSVVYTDSQVADAYGNFNFNLWNAFDLQRGQVVTVSDGINTKTHTVMPLYIDAVNVTSDTLFGRGDANADVEIWVHGDGNLTVTPEGSGNWTADFSGQTDLTFLSDGGSQQFDDDGDATGVWWASPRFQVAPEDDWVQSWNRWTPGATISLTIEDSSGVLYTDTQTADTNGNFNFNLWDRFDLKRGQLVTVSDGTTAKSHTVLPLYVDSVDVASNTISGRGVPNTDVEVWVHGDGNLYVTADSSGTWSADFSGQTDLTYVNDGGSQQMDDDGDSTGVWWSSPSFQVSPDENWVQSWNRWTPGATVTLTIENGSGGAHSYSQTADAHGNFNFSNLWPVDLDTGYMVTVSDGTIVKTHTVTDVNVTDINMDTDQIRGTANPGASVRVQAYDFNNWSERTVSADLDGNWVADFSLSADGQPAFNITDTTFINVNEFDEDGDSTYRRFGAPIQGSTGVAVTSIDNNVWVANRNSGTVTRLDNDGNVLKMIETGQVPTGVAADAAGKVWATNLGSDNTVRIDPNAGTDGLGEVDLTVDLGPGASPYNYSDMTGAVVVGSTSPQGFWTVIQDSRTPGFEWGRILWNTEPEGNEPSGTAIVVEARSADTEAGLGGQTFQTVANGELFSMFGRYIEVRVTLKASPGGVSPVLSDIRIQPHNQPPVCTEAAPSVATIWPPNNKFVKITILGITDPDDDPVTITIDSIFQDEPTDTYGDGAFTPDGRGVGTDTASVRAERSGTKKVPGDGRVYHIGFTADDGIDSCSGTVTVGVPHDVRDVPVDGGPLYDSTLP